MNKEGALAVKQDENGAQDSSQHSRPSVQVDNLAVVADSHVGKDGRDKLEADNGHNAGKGSDQKGSTGPNVDASRDANGDTSGQDAVGNLSRLQFAVAKEGRSEKGRAGGSQETNDSVEVATQRVSVGIPLGGRHKGWPEDPKNGCSNQGQHVRHTVRGGVGLGTAVNGHAKSLAGRQTKARTKEMDKDGSTNVLRSDPAKHQKDLVEGIKNDFKDGQDEELKRRGLANDGSVGNQDGRNAKFRIDNGVETNLVGQREGSDVAHGRVEVVSNQLDKEVELQSKDRQHHGEADRTQSVLLHKGHQVSGRAHKQKEEDSLVQLLRVACLLLASLILAVDERQRDLPETDQEHGHDITVDCVILVVKGGVVTIGRENIKQSQQDSFNEKQKSAKGTLVGQGIVHGGWSALW